MVLRTRKLSFGGYLFLGVALLLTRAWANLQPSIKPSDVHVQAVLVPPGAAANPLPAQEHQWTLEVALDKSTQRPLYVSEGEGFFQVTPYVAGMAPVSWDFFQGLTNGNSGSPRGDTGSSMGFDGRHVPLVVGALGSEGVSVTDRQVEANTAFGYVGETFPARVRYYLTGTEFGGRAYVVYSHYERRWGKDLSWASVFPAAIAKPRVVSFQVKTSEATYTAGEPSPIRVLAEPHVKLKATVEHADAVRFVVESIEGKAGPIETLGPFKPDGSGAVEADWTLSRPDFLYIVHAQALQKPPVPSQAGEAVDGQGNWVAASGALRLQYVDLVRDDSDAAHLLVRFADLVSRGNTTGAADLLAPGLQGAYEFNNYAPLRNTPSMEVIRLEEMTGDPHWPPDVGSRDRKVADVRVFAFDVRYRVLGIIDSYFRDGEVYHHKATVVRYAADGPWQISGLSGFGN